MPRRFSNITEVGNVEQIRSELFPHMRGKTVAIFDTETTGVRDTDKIIQFSAIKAVVNPDMTLKQIDSGINFYVDPLEPLNPKITEITGITDKMLKEGGMKDKLAAYRRIENYMQSADFWAGYNIAFDLQKIAYLGERVGQSMEMKPAIDVMAWAKMYCPRAELGNKYNLGVVTHYLLPNFEAQFHDSFEDVKATGNVMNELMKRFVAFDRPERPKRTLSRASMFMMTNRQQILDRIAGIREKRRTKHEDGTLGRENNPLKERLNAQFSRIYIELSDNGSLDDIMGSMTFRTTESRNRFAAELRKPGNIFYNIPTHEWAAKKGRAPEALFKQTDIQDLEKQVLRRYKYDSMAALADSWYEYRWEQEKSRFEREKADIIKAIEEKRSCAGYLYDPDTGTYTSARNYR